MPKARKSGLETPDSLRKLVEALHDEATSYNTVPEGYHTPEEVAKARGGAVDTVRKQLRKLVQQGKATRVLVCHEGLNNRRAYYKIK